MDVPFTITYNDRKKTEASPNPSTKKQHGTDVMCTPVITPRKQKSDKINLKKVVTKKFERGSPGGQAKVEVLSPIIEDMTQESQFINRLT